MRLANVLASAFLLSLFASSAFAEQKYYVSFTNPNPRYIFTVHAPSTNPVNPVNAQVDQGTCMTIWKQPVTDTDVTPASPLIDMVIADKNSEPCSNREKTLPWYITVRSANSSIPSPKHGYCILDFWHGHQGSPTGHWYTSITGRNGQDCDSMVQQVQCTDNNSKNVDCWGKQVRSNDNQHIRILFTGNEIK